MPVRDFKQRYLIRRIARAIYDVMVFRREKETMSKQIDDLNAAVARLEAAQSAHHTSSSAELTEANSAMEAATARITAAAESLEGGGSGSDTVVGADTLSASTSF